MSIIVILTLCTSLQVSVYAQSNVPDTAKSPTPEADSEEDSLIKQRIDDLKERLATRVAQLQLVNKRGFYGILKDKTDTKFTLTYKESSQPVATDTETTLYSKSLKGKKTETDLDSLDPGQTIVVFGTLDIDQKTIIAQTIIAQELPTVYYGIVTSIDTTDGSFAVKDSETTTFDYEINTTCMRYSGESELESCGLSKIEVGDTVIVHATADSQNLNSAKALRIVVLPQSVEPTEVTNSPTPKPTEEGTEVTP